MKHALHRLFCLLLCAVLFVGMLLYKETISAKQLVGVVVCGIGLFLVSK